MPGETGSLLTAGPCSRMPIAEKVSSRCWGIGTAGFGQWNPNPSGSCPPECLPSGIRSLPTLMALPGHSPSQQPQPQETSEQQREQELQLQKKLLREDTTFHGAAIGQTGTSTRQELTAWIRVLAIPCRSMYATDSASMLNKALRLIQDAERNLRGKASGAITLRGNPFGKAWGLQVDGDLWEQAWNAVLIRGIGNQHLRKVKGHATEEDVEKGNCY